MRFGLQRNLPGVHCGAGGPRQRQHGVLALVSLRCNAWPPAGPRAANPVILSWLSQPAPQQCASSSVASQLSPVALIWCCSIAGFYMPDNAGGSNFTRPANGDSCLPCPVRATLLWLPVCGMQLAALPTNGFGLLTSSPPLLCFLQVNTYQPSTGKAACIQCAAGSSTEDTGNTACQPCSSGYYSPNICEYNCWHTSVRLVVLPAPTALLPCCLVQSADEHPCPLPSALCPAATACVPAPRGTYVAGTGAKMYTPW